MTNLLRAAAQFLQTKMEAHASIDILYKRVGTSRWVPMVAVVGRTANEVETTSGFTVQSNYRDFIVRPSAFAEFEPPYPLRNDSVRVAGDGAEMIYKVNADGIAAPYEEIDGYGVAIRIHSVRDWFASAPTN